ncbi:MAG: HD domain-containing protein [Pseudonocardiaceae bacterium]
MMLSSLSAGVPDSKIAHAVTDLARQAYPPFLFNHCVRTFWFADRLAASGLKFDRELVYIAAMLHDIGVLEPYDQGARFEVDGAQAAREFLAGHVYPAEKIEVVWDAIALHTDLAEIGQYKAPEVHLVSLGAGADAVGSRVADLDPGFVRELIEEFPRLDFTNEFRQALIENVRRIPSRARGTFLAPVGQVVELFANNPLDTM